MRSRFPFKTFLLCAALISGCAHSPTDLPGVPDEVIGKEEPKKHLREPVMDYGEVEETPYRPTSVDQLVFQSEGQQVPMATFIWAPESRQATKTLRKSATQGDNPPVEEGVVHHYLMLPDGKMVRVSHKLSEHQNCEFCLDYE